MSGRLSDVLAGARAPRSVHGISATLLPYGAGGTPDWPAFEQHLARTRDAGLDCAVNMDTGFGDLLTPAQREEVLDVARSAIGADDGLFAGAFCDAAADPIDGYLVSITAITARGAIPVVMQNAFMHGLGAAEKATLYQRLANSTDRLLAFELGRAFSPNGEIWDDETYARVIEIPGIIGAKHSSLDREVELRRLAARDRLRPDFRVYTGNDLAIDMVLYGSDYLLGLSTFAPAAFARRDAALAADDVDFLRLNDALQHLGNVAFRAPVPAYKDSAATFLDLTGQVPGARPHPQAARRPAADREILADCAARLDLPHDPVTS